MTMIMWGVMWLAVLDIAIMETIMMRVRLELNAGTAIIDDKNDLMLAENNVIIKNTRGDILETEKLNWDQNKKEIFTNEFVKITTKNEVIYGIGLESNQNFSKYSIRNIKGVITINQSNE